jgi:predicted permease
MFGALVRGLRPLFFKSRAEREMEAEIRFHIDMETAKNVERGMAPDEARRAALAAFGGVESTKEWCREAWLGRTVESLLHDLRYGLRSLRRSPGYAAVVAVTLALGVGANTAVFSAINGVLLQPLPYDDGGRLVLLYQQALGVGPDRVRFSPLEIADYRERARSLERIEEFHSMLFVLLGAGEPERVRTGVVSAGYFEMLGVAPVLGRSFEAADERAGAEPVLLLGYDYWRDRYGADESVVGRSVRMNDRVHTIAGVLPPLPHFPEQCDVYMTTAACPFRSSERTTANRRARMSQIVARLAPGATVDAARDEVAGISADLAREHPEAYPDSEKLAASLASLDDEMTREARPTFLLLLATAGFVLLIACANAANLAYARANRRERELGIRAALGAGRLRIARQLLTESAILALMGGVLGLGLAAAGLRLIVAFASRFTPRADEIALDTTVLLFALAISVLAGLLVGLLPALPVQGRLAALVNGESGRTTGSAGRARVRNALVVVQVAVSFALLVTAGLFVRSIIHLQSVDPGYDPERVVAMCIPLNWSKYSSEEQRRRFYTTLLERVEQDPRVLSAAASTKFPLDGTGAWTLPIRVESLDAEAAGLTRSIDYRVVTPDYFRTVGIPLLEGRLFGPGDALETENVAVVNLSTARRFWGDGRAVGQRVMLAEEDGWVRVGGVVGDVKQYGLDTAPADEIYRPLSQAGYAGCILARTSADPLALARDARELVYAIDGDQPVTEVTTLEAARDESLSPPRLTATLVALFAAVALAITIAGVAGALALWVSQRTREIGVRMAMGASPARVLAFAMREGLGLVVAGLAIGLVGALLLSSLLTGWLYGVEPTDPVTYVAVSAALLAAAAAACFVPAYRAASVDPMTTLRAE